MATYGQLTAKHPQYDAPFYARLRALYEGGRKLTADDKIMRDVFPQHPGERDDTYKIRRRMAYYIPYLGQIIDFLIVGLRTDPANFENPDDADDEKPAKASKKAPSFYDDFSANTAKRGAEAVTFGEAVCAALLDALLFRTSYVLVDLPAVAPAEVIATALDEEKAGLDRAYLCPLGPERVFDFEEDDDGILTWINVHTLTSRRPSIDSNRNMIREEFTIYTATDWRRFAIEYTKEKPPVENSDVPLVAEGTHSFGRVPVRRLTLPAGLWAAGKIEGMAIEHLNKRCALSWGQYKGLFQFLAINLADVNPSAPDSKASDTTRALSQPIGPGRMLQLAEKDQLRYVGPDVGPFAEARADLDGIRDEMHRVLWAMAQSVDNSGAALKRSADSKKVDSGITSIVLRALGSYGRKFGVDLLDTVAEGRKDKIAIEEWKISGLAEFDDVSTDALIAEAGAVDLIDIPSAKFHAIYKTKIALRLIAEEVTEEDRKIIASEIEEGTADVGMPDEIPEIDPATGLPILAPKAPGFPAKAPKGPPPPKAPPKAPPRF